MTIIVFLLDTSASMNQRTFIGARPTMLDIAKGAVETFVKLRQRSPESRGDRYMLFTFEDPPLHIKAGWKENLATFMNELKNIWATGLSTLGPAIKNVFDVLNINRMQSGIDTYGTGRSPFFLEPSVIIIITDGGKLSSQQGVHDDIFPLPKVNLIPGADLTKEVFRWDQRLFGLVLRLTGTPAPDPMGLVPSDNSPLDKLCEQTGGRSYAVRSHRMFQQCIDSLVQKVQSGVVINFEKIGPDPPPINADGKETPDIIEVDKENQQQQQQGVNNQDNNSNSLGGPVGGGGGLGGGGMLGHVLQNGSGRPHTPNSSLNPAGQQPPLSNAWHNCRKMIYVPRPAQRGSPSGFWPIPESFWPDINTLALPPRSAHPNVKFTCTSQEPMVIDNLPFDKYELEPSPLTQYILSRKQPTVCWQVYIPNSSKNNDVGHPFGYLKASTTLQTVNLFVMPYNYPVLLPLLDDLFKTHRLKPTKEWRMQFENYHRTMPPYYANPLKRALGRMGAPNLVPDNLDNSLSFQVTNHLKRLKNQAKLEYERICLEVEKRLSQNACVVHEGIRVQPRRPLSRHLTSNHTLQDKLAPLRDQVTEYPSLLLAVREGEVNPQMYRNPFDVPRTALLDQLTRMRANFLQNSLRQLLTDRDLDQLHCRPISQMGNYQEYLKKMTPALREIESTPVRQHMFGNPFKIDKKMSMMVDEADVDLMGGTGGANSGGRGSKRPAEAPSPVGRPNKRRRGPLPLDFTLQRINRSPSSSPMPSPPASPMPPVSPSSPCLPITPIPSPPESPTLPRMDEQRGDQLKPDTLAIDVPALPSPPVPVVSSIQTPVFQSGSYPPSGLTYSPGMQSVSPPGSPAPPSSLPPSPSPASVPPPSLASPPSIEDSSRENVPVINGEVSQLPMPLQDEDGPPSTDSAYDAAFEGLQPPTLTPPPEAAAQEDNTEKNRTNAVENRTTGNGGSVVIAWDTQETKTYNKELKLLCFKLVKKPGRDFSRLFAQLNTVKGSHESRLKTVREVVQEAGRFKRHSLVKLLSQFLQTMTEKGAVGGGAGVGPASRTSVRVNGHSR